MNNKFMTKTAVIAIIYIVVTLWIPFDQFRVAEFLMFVVFFNKKNAYGIILGCFVANLILSHMPMDIIFGTAATAITCYLMSITKQKYLAYLWPALVNGVVIGWELMLITNISFWFYFGQVFVGEFVVTFVLWFITMPILSNNKVLKELLS